MLLMLRTYRNSKNLNTLSTLSLKWKHIKMNFTNFPMKEYMLHSVSQKPFQECQELERRRVDTERTNEMDTTDFCVNFTI